MMILQKHSTKTNQISTKDCLFYKQRSWCKHYLYNTILVSWQKHDEWIIFCPLVQTKNMYDTKNPNFYDDSLKTALKLVRFAPKTVFLFLTNRDLDAISFLTKVS